MKDIILIGAGKRAQQLANIPAASEVNIIGIFDSDISKDGEKIRGVKISYIDEVRNYKNIEWCVTVSDVSAKKLLREKCIGEHSLKSEDEISYMSLILYIFLHKNISLDHGNENIQSGSDYILKNIIFDCSNGFILGGIENWTVDLCTAMMSQKKDNIYIIAHEGNYHVPDAIADHVLYVGKKNALRFSEKTIKLIIDVMIRHLPCTVITSQPDECLIAAYILKRRFPEHVRIISVIHGSKDNIYDDYRALLEVPDIFIGVSQKIKNDFIDMGVPKKRVYSMMYPFDCREVLNRTYSLDRNYPIRIGYAGRMDGFKGSQKRMDLILNLIELLYAMNVNFNFELAGDGPVRGDMERFIREHGFYDRVKFIGTVDNDRIVDFWARQDICVNLADFEGRSISIIEAMGAGAVPVVTDTSGVRDDIIDGSNGYIIPVGDHRSAADRIAFLETERSLLPKMGSLAHDEVYPKSLMSEHLKFWNRIIEQVM